MSGQVKLSPTLDFRFFHRPTIRTAIHLLSSSDILLDLKTVIRVLSCNDLDRLSARMKGMIVHDEGLSRAFWKNNWSRINLLPDAE